MVEYIDRETAIDFAKHAIYKGLNVVEYLEEVPAADVVERPRWIPVTEEMPLSGQRVLAFSGWPGEDLSFSTPAKYEDGKWKATWNWDEIYDVTYWMPMPEPPTEVDDENT